jgi:hypothetical protein
MKSFQQFISESVTIHGDFNGTLNVGSSQPEQQQESFFADVVWRGNLYRMEIMTESGLPTRQELGQQLQEEYPGAIVHNVYPGEAQSKIKSAKRYQPERLNWSD